MYNSVYIERKTFQLERATIIIYQRLDLPSQNSDFCAYRYFMATKANLFDSAYKQETGGPFSKLIHKSSLRGVVCLGGRYKCAYFQRRDSRSHLFFSRLAFWWFVASNEWRISSSRKFFRFCLTDDKRRICIQHGHFFL